MHTHHHSGKTLPHETSFHEKKLKRLQGVCIRYRQAQINFYLRPGPHL